MESFRKLRDDKGKVEFCEDESSDENDGNGRTPVSLVDDERADENDGNGRSTVESFHKLHDDKDKVERVVDPVCRRSSVSLIQRVTVPECHCSSVSLIP